MDMNKENRRRLPVACVVAVGIVLSLLVYWQVQNWEQEKLQNTYKRAAEKRVHTIQESISASLGVLQGVGAFYGVLDAVTRSQFKAYVTPLIGRHGTIQALEWIPRVPGERRAEYENSARAEGFPKFEFKERGPDGSLIRAGARPEYYPVFFVEPAKGNTRAFGFDLGSEQSRRTALEEAQDTGQMAVSGRIKLDQESGESYAVLVFLPIFRNGLPSATVLERRQNLVGFALGVFHITNIVEQADPHIATDGEQETQVLIIDSLAAEGNRLLYSSSNKESKTTEIDQVSNLHYASNISVANQTWAIIVTPSGELGGDQLLSLALVTLVAGFLCTGMLAVYVRTTSIRTGQIESEVQDGTRQISDISRRLRDREQRIRAVHDTVIDGIITIDSKGVIETVNPAVEQMFGYASDEILGQNVRMLMPQPYRSGHDGYLRNFLNTGEAKVIGIGREVVGQRKDGSTFPMDLAVNEMRIGSQRMFTGIVRDITERKMIDQLKSDFISTVSHELRTPLASIVGYSDLIMDGDAGEISEEAEQFVEIISNNAVRLADLINDLLDIEKIESGKYEMDLRLISLGEVLADVHATFKLPAEQKGLSLEVSDYGELNLEGDANRLTQVFSNLVSNAIKYTKAGGVKISADRSGEDIVVNVSDTGIGLSPEDVDKLFEKFFRANNEYARSAGGTGLGLSIAKSIVEEHKGSFEVQSIFDEGSQFIVRLPAADPHKDHTSGVTLRAEESRETPNILIIGNESYPQKLLQAELGSLGVETVFTANAEEGIKLAGLLKPSLVVLEMLLDNGDGLRVAWRLGKDAQSERIPLALISLLPNGNGTLSIGASSFVPKQVLASGLKEFASSHLTVEGGKVLVIDDDPDFGAVIHLTLQKHGIEGDTGKNGAEAIKLCAENAYQLVLMDYHLPDMTGADILKNIRRDLNINTPVVMMSGAGIEKGVQRELPAIGAGFSPDGKLQVGEIARLMKAEMTRGN